MPRARGEAEVLLESDEDKFVTDWSRDGAYAGLQRAERQETDLGPLGPAHDGGDRKPIPLAQDEVRGAWAAPLSPDGRFLAYHSNESGRSEVYVQEFPEARSKWQVSPDGGRDPFWRGDGRELYYRAPDVSSWPSP